MKMKRGLRDCRWALVALALVLSPSLSGCVALVAGAGAGAGTVAYIKGEHSQVHGAAYERVWAATQNALKQMNIRVAKSEKDALGGIIEARRADDTAVDIKVEPVGSDAARVKIRIGMFGDKAASEAIQARIAVGLGGR
jgi:uncharacterized lipoprotein